MLLSALEMSRVEAWQNSILLKAFLWGKFRSRDAANISKTKLLPFVCPNAKQIYLPTLIAVLKSIIARFAKMSHLNLQFARREFRENTEFWRYIKYLALKIRDILFRLRNFLK